MAAYWIASTRSRLPRPYSSTLSIISAIETAVIQASVQSIGLREVEPAKRAWKGIAVFPYNARHSCPLAAIIGPIIWPEDSASFAKQYTGNQLPNARRISGEETLNGFHNFLKLMLLHVGKQRQVQYALADTLGVFAAYFRF